jgi:processive 1,2-diacylglycerol beta-glucosyltransferase
MREVRGLAEKLRVLIVSASVGSGHTQAALSIKQALKKEYGCNALVIDFLSGGGRYLGKVVKSTYFRTLKLFPEIWDYVYRYSNKERYGEKIKSVLQLASERYMLRIIRRYSPHVLVFTHPFPCGAAAGLKKDGKISVPLVGVVTDYAVHRLWEYPEVDYYCVATEELAGELLSQGFPRSAVYSVGIPVHEHFRLNLASVHQPGGVLIMGGGWGMGPMAQVVQAIASIPQVSHVKVVCGKNLQLYQMLKSPEVRSPKIRVYGFTHKIPELMAEADVLITKPGGLTASEALAIGLPMILIDAIGGQEEDNAAFLVENGVARWAHSMDELTFHTRALLAAPEQLKNMRERCLQIGRPDAASSVAKIINQALKERSTRL